MSRTRHHRDRRPRWAGWIVRWERRHREARRDARNELREAGAAIEEFRATYSEHSRRLDYARLRGATAIEVTDPIAEEAMGAMLAAIEPQRADEPRYFGELKVNLISEVHPRAALSSRTWTFVTLLGVGGGGRDRRTGRKRCEFDEGH